MAANIWEHGASFVVLGRARGTISEAGMSGASAYVLDENRQFVGAPCCLEQTMIEIDRFAPEAGRGFVETLTAARPSSTCELRQVACSAATRPEPLSAVIERHVNFYRQPPSEAKQDHGPRLGRDTGATFR